MNAPGMLDRIETQLVRVGAAMAANNQQAFREAFDELTAMGVGADKVTFATGVGTAVREQPVVAMQRFVGGLLGMKQAEAAPSRSCPAERISDTAVLRLMMLIAVASAVAANCEPCLNQSVIALSDGRVPEEEIRRAAEIGLEVKESEAEDIRDAAVVLTGIKQARRAA